MPKRRNSPKKRVGMKIALVKKDETLSQRRNDWRISKHNEVIAMSVAKELVRRTQNHELKQTNDLDNLLRQRFESNAESGNFELILDDKEMNAWLKTTPPKSGFLRIERSQADALVASLGISHGVLSEYFEKIPSDAPGMTLIAKGTKPVNGEDAKLIPIYKEMQKNQPENHEGNSDSVDLREVKTFITVRKGEALVEKIPIGSGAPGMTVTGKAIPAKHGKDIVLIPGENIEISDDGLLLKAACDGVLLVNGTRFSLTKLYEVDGDVDYSVGNINFAGCVRIKGNVLPGFKVTATEIIEVEGSVDHATLEAGSDIKIQKGYYGNANARIEAGGSLYVRSLENANVKVTNEIRAMHYIINSDVKAGGSVIVEHPTKGRISGGTIVSGDLVETFLLGSPMYTKTNVEIVPLSASVCSSNYYFNMVNYYENAIEKISSDIEMLKTTAGAQSIKAEVVDSVRTLRGKVAQHRRSLEKLHAMNGIYNKGSKSAPIKEIRVKGICFSGTSLKYEGSLVKVDNDLRGIVVRVKNDEFSVEAIV
jgi:uncharacterized protein